MGSYVYLSDRPVLKHLLDSSAFVEVLGDRATGVVRIIGDTPTSLVVTPVTPIRSQLKDAVIAIKVPKFPLVVTSRQEADLLEQLSVVKQDLFKIPRAIAANSSPAFLIMEKMGAPLCTLPQYTDMTAETAKKLGKAIGMFAARIFEHDYVHTALHIGNLTDEGKRIGILGFSSLRETPCAIERMMGPSMLTNTTLAMTLAATFSRATGECFRLNKLGTEAVHLFNSMHNNRLISSDTVERSKATYADFMKRAQAYPRYFR